MNKAVWLAKRNYWIVGIGVLVSLFSFLALNFLNVSYSFSLSGLGLGSTTSTYPSSYSVPVSAVAVASSQGLLWISLLLTIAILIVAILFLARRNPFGSKVSTMVQARWTALGFIITAVLAALCEVASLTLIAQNAQNAVQSLLGSESSSLGSLGLGSSYANLFHFDFIWGIGAYFFLAGLIVVVVAGLMELIWPAKILSDAEMAAAWNYPQNQYPQNQYNYPTGQYGQPPMPAPQPFTDSHSHYGGNLPQQEPANPAYPPNLSNPAYPPAPGQQPSANPYQPPAQFPPYSQ